MPRSPKKILIIGSFPIVQPRHGGQKRVEAIVREYKKHFAQVKFVAVFSRWANPAYAHSDLPVSHATDRLIQQSAKLEDITCGEAIIAEPAIKRRLSKLLLSYRPDIIQIEQVYSYIGLKPLLEELGLHPKLIFDTHNVESEMKRVVYRASNLPETRTRDLLARLAEWERDLAATASLTVAVSQADLEAYNHLGAARTTLAPNGIYPAPATASAVSAWRKQFAQTGYHHTFLYVSSAHLPNWVSFLDMVGDGLGFLPPSARLIIAGGLSDYLENRHKWPLTPGAATFWCRATAAGILPENRLAGLLAAADTIILPVTTGGGSNLKTAEALLSGKPIIATSYAFRAYEQFMNLPTVTIADQPQAFRTAMVQHLTARPPRLTPGQLHEVSQTVTWPHALAQLIEQVAAL